VGTPERAPTLLVIAGTEHQRTPDGADPARAVPGRRGVQALVRLRRIALMVYFLLRRALGDASLGDGLAGRIAFVAAHIAFATGEVLRPDERRERMLRLRLAGRSRQVWVADRTELFALGDIFLGGEYDGIASDPRVILDLGANIGAATLYFHSRFPHARIYAVEADPDTAQRLRRNVNDLANVEVVQCAVGGRTRRGVFERSWRSSASRLAVGPDQSGIEIDVYSFDDLLERCGIDRVDLLKIDIEGAEFELLDHASRLADVAEVVVELHRDHPDARVDAERWLEGVAKRSGLSLVSIDHDVFALRRTR
jgi:FkbM family methyltransferase